MRTEDFLRFLSENEVWKTIIPTLNLWLFYVITCVILWGVFNVAVAGLVFAFGIIFAWAQKEKTKKAFHSWWHALPLLKFHAVCVCLELGVFTFLIKFTNTLTFVGNLVKKNGQRK